METSHKNVQNQTIYKLMRQNGVTMGRCKRAMIALYFDSNRAFARAIGQSHTHVNNWINGKTSNKVAESALGINTDA